jgi:RNA polymerase sigma-70 factor (ECF subfamily)
VNTAQAYYPDCPEPLLVNLARSGDRAAFEELVRRRQGQVRGLMRRLAGDGVLADDLAQQVFLKVWLGIRTLRKARAFPAWLKRVAVNVWLQHARKHDALKNADDLAEGLTATARSTPGIRLDLNQALAALPVPVRACLVLSYEQGMSHGDIAELTELPLGTVKSHIRRGAARLRELLEAYGPGPESGGSEVTTT